LIGMNSALQHCMPRESRENTLQECTLLHKIWRGHNRENNIQTDDEKSFYLDVLNEKLPDKECEFRAINLLSNHTHELYQISDIKVFSEFMRSHHTKYGMFFNKKHVRTGKVAEERPKTVPIKSDFQEMIATFYIHTNPLKHGIVHTMEELRHCEWSTHILYGYGIYKKWMKKIILPQWYFNLGTTEQHRQDSYLFLVKEYVSMSEHKFIKLYGDGAGPSPLLI
jgi:REP element-mobilizing transposase RayT